MSLLLLLAPTVGGGGGPTPGSSSGLKLPLSTTVSLAYPSGLEAGSGTRAVIDPSVIYSITVGG